MIAGRAITMLVALCLMLPVAARAGVFNPETFRLENGMRVVVVPNHRVPVVTHMVWYRVGSADEQPGNSGIAHFLEHLMFKGTPKVPGGEFSRIVARNGGRENAFTSYDYTGYHQTLAVDRLELVMGLEADRMTNLVLNTKTVEPERLVILEERRQRIENNPGAILREHVNAAMYRNHPYRQPVIGWEHEIRTLAIPDILAFYRRWYAPNNAVLVVAGDITAKELRPMAERTYGQIPAQPATTRSGLSRNRPTEPPQRAARRLTLHDKRVRQPSWSRTYLAPSRMTSLVDSGISEQADALEIMAEILGQGATSRLYQALVVERKIAVSAGARYDPDNLGPSRFGIHASPRPGTTIEELESAVMAVVDELVAGGITADELARTKQRMKASAVYARDSLRTGARVLGSALAIGMSIEDVERWPERIAAVTIDQVNRAARMVINEDRSVTAMLLPEKKDVSQ